jgi:endonuclease/exonuclease/phosphatase family metal-dependent hydrolase
MRSLLVLTMVLAATAARAQSGALSELLDIAGVEAPPPVPLPAAGPAHGRRLFKVLTFNIKDNPHARLTGWGLSRFNRIGEELARRRAAGDPPDVVLLQEAFNSGDDRIRRRAGYAYAVRGPRPDRTLLDGGLWVLSDHPITARQVIAYTHDTCSSFDCWATKGAVRVRLEVPGLPFPVDVLTTHAQSGRKPRAEKGREAQFGQLRALLPLGAHNPAFIAGDFNTDARRPESYAALAAAVSLPNAGADCAAAAGGCVVAPGTDAAELQARTNDQQFYAPGGASFRVRPVYAARTFTPLDAFSDHLGFEVWYEITW